MTSIDLKYFESLFATKILELTQDPKTADPAHDFLHFQRVVATAKKLCHQEGAEAAVVIPAAWLHDLVIIPKNDPRRSQASRLSAQAATEFLRELNYPKQWLAPIAHAIAAHSFSAEIQPETIEARIVQDADRLDGLGAIGIARCFAVAGLLRRTFYSEQDPFCQERKPDDATFTIDHFYAKLFRTAQTLQTQAGRLEGTRRVHTMQLFLDALQSELSNP